uniref:Tc1-like transposase DDE domain-containing protein n=1 Tax=Lepeophtheirus salmonis TaxID=72036 RepID=A0A0K2V0Z8_LEPSM
MDKTFGQTIVLGLVASNSKNIHLFFFKGGEKIGLETYYKVLRFTILPWLKATYPEDNYVCAQDGVPSHKSGKYQKFCTDNMVDFWPKDMWPSSSPDLNPLDLAV